MMKDNTMVTGVAVYIAFNEKHTNFCIYSWTLLKILIISKQGLNKNYLEFNFVQKTQWARMSISPRSGVRGLHRLPCLKYWNGKVDSLSEGADCQPEGVDLKPRSIFVKVCPHLYTNTNEVYRTEANPNDCQKWLFGIRLVKRTASIANVFFFEVPTPNGKAFGRSPNIRCSNECCWLLLGYTSISTFLSLTHASFGICIQMWMRLKGNRWPNLRPVFVN